MTVVFHSFVIAGLDPAIYPSNLTDDKLGLEQGGAKRRNPMGASTPDKIYRDWRDAVDKRLHQIYCITIEDAGFDEGYLIDHWRSNEAPFEFVEWFVNKYGLDPISLFVPPLKRGN